MVSIIKPMPTGKPTKTSKSPAANKRKKVESKTLTFEQEASCGAIGTGNLSKASESTEALTRGLDKHYELEVDRVRWSEK